MDLRKQLFSSAMPASSPLSAEPTKRASDDALEDTPAAKRAKRSKSGKKRRSEEDLGADGVVVQDDWASFNSSPATGGRNHEEVAPVYPSTPFPFKSGSKIKVPVSAEKPAEKSGEKYVGEIHAEIGEGKESSTMEMNDGPNETASHQSPKTEAKPRKNRAERRLKKKTVEELPLAVLPEGPEDETEKKRPSPEPVTTNGMPTSKTGASPKTDRISMAQEPEAPESTNLLDNSEIVSSNPTGLRTLKAISKHLKSIDAKLTSGSGSGNSNGNGSVTAATDAELASTLQSLRVELSALQHRLHRDALRASFRHEIVFNALKKVSTDVNRLGQQLQGLVQGGGGGGETGHGYNNEGSVASGSLDDATAAATPRSSTVAKARAKALKDGAALEQSRKTLERCLSGFHEDMNKAGSADEVKKLGRLCVQYAGDLFKTLG